MGTGVTSTGGIATHTPAEKMLRQALLRWNSSISTKPRGLHSPGTAATGYSQNLAFWDGHPGFAEVTVSSDFTFADLERETVTVYLTIPFKDMATSYRYLRAMVGLAFAAMEEKQEARQASVLFILDEFAALRDMEFMRDAVAQSGGQAQVMNAPATAQEVLRALKA